jgi:hypothetical protein
MSNNTVKLTPDEIYTLGSHHAEREAACDLAAVMDTLGDNPSYLYPTIGKRFTGRERSKRFYEYFFKNFTPNVISGKLIREWSNDTSVAQEYDITLSFSGIEETHRVLGVLFVEGDKLGGEVVYASDHAIRRMLGPIYDELEPC